MQVRQIDLAEPSIRLNAFTTKNGKLRTVCRRSAVRNTVRRGIGETYRDADFRAFHREVLKRYDVTSEVDLGAASRLIETGAF